LAFLLSATLVADPVLPMAKSQGAAYTLHDCFRAALGQSESLSITGETINQAEARYREAIANVVPNISLSGQLYTQAEPVGGVPTNENFMKFTATQSLFQGFREYAALRQTKNQLASSKQAYAWAAWQLYADTAQVFNLVLSSEKALDVLQSELALYDQRIQFLQGWFHIGRAQDTDVLSAQSAQAQIKAQVEQAKYQIAATREALTFLTGLAVDVRLADIQEPPEALSAMEVYVAELDKRPDVEAARLNVKAAEEGVRIAWGAHLPSVNAQADYYPYRYTPYTDANWDAFISFSMPIFMGGMINAQTRSAESIQHQAELALQQTLRMDRENLRSSYQKLHYDLSQGRALVEAADLADKNYRAETRNFEHGLVTNLDVLQSMVTFTNTALARDSIHYSTLSDYQSLQAQIGHVPGFTPKPEEER
jgi:outer membrane protein TolC